MAKANQAARSVRSIGSWAFYRKQASMMRAAKKGDKARVAVLIKDVQREQVAAQKRGY